MNLSLPDNALPVLYTAGYQGHTPEHLLTLAARLNAAVVDVRLSPRSINPHWRLTYLTRLFGVRYLHLPQWGNLHYNQPLPIKISDFECGLNTLQDWLAVDWIAALPFTSAILLCQCRDAECCHRTTLAERLRAQGYAVSELDWRQAAETPVTTEVTP